MEEFKFHVIVPLARKAMGLTQKELCVKLGISRSNLAGIESGQLHPGIKSAVKICQTLGISLDECCGITSSKFIEAHERFEKEKDRLIKEFTEKINAL